MKKQSLTKQAEPAVKKETPVQTIQLNIAEQHGIVALLAKREQLIQEVNQTNQQLEKSQESIISTRGFKDMDGWKLNTQTWILTKAPK